MFEKLKNSNDEIFFSKLQYVSILRPTSPFRDANTIKRAHKNL